MKTKGSIAQLLGLLITVVLTSAGILLLVQAGVITVRAESTESVLNTEFIVNRGGEIQIQDFKFCKSVDDTYNCLGEGDSFLLGEKVYFRFGVETSTYQGQVLLVENYQVKGPDGRVLIEVDQKRNFNVDFSSKESMEDVSFKDFLVTNEKDQLGEYTLDLVMENPLLNKKVTITKRFRLE